jgi:hypothetical protein
MIEIVDTRTYEVLGLRYSHEERAAALFSVSLFLTILETGRSPFEVMDHEDALESARQLEELLLENCDIVEPATHEILRQRYLRCVADMHSGLLIAPVNYRMICEKLGIRPYDLFSNALSSFRIIESEGWEQEFVEFGSPGK